MNLKFIFNTFNTLLTSYAGKVTMENKKVSPLVFGVRFVFHTKSHHS